MSMADLHLGSVIAGMALAALAALLAAGLLLGTRNSLPRRLADALLNRRGFEKLGDSHRTRPRDTFYDRWLEQARDRIPVRDCMFIEDVRTIDLEPWEEEGAGVHGLYLRLADYQVTDARILELPPGGGTREQQQAFEIVAHVVRGSGYTELGEDAKDGRIDWRQGQVFSIPLNAAYRHFCTGEESARLLVFTSFPLLINLVNDADFVHENPFRFSERSAPEAVLDARAQSLRDHGVRGKGVKAQYFDFGGNTQLSVNLSEMPAESIKRAHRANSDAAVLMLSGEGILVTWPDGAWHKRVQIEWQEGTLIALPIYWYRQFLNTGTVPARNLTAGARLLVERLGLRLHDQRENDLPAVRRLFRSALRSRQRGG